MDSQSPPAQGENQFRNPLPPGDKDTPKFWQESAIGVPREWPPILQAYALTAASFSYPAAIFWGEQLILLQNQAWFQADGAYEQGQAQRARLAKETSHAVNATLHGGKPYRIDSSQLLQDGDNHTVLISPLFGEGEERKKAVGVLAQLLVEPRSRSSPNERAGDPPATAPYPNLLKFEELGAALGKVPFDRHPFFHRFAELLPSGLAILDPSARAIFVNQQFYDLTTHQGDEREFKCWPQSIHPDDYDRVMAAYQDAFRSQKQLRTEFRAYGAKHPWRLLLLMPLGDDILKYVSLREHGGFVCSIVDITSEKSAEIAERKAAQEARDRKEQQERFIDMVSHEIRNPLSAILHCTEDIEEAIKPNNAGRTNVSRIKEALETINLCIQHQKRIVDDVLYFSKLDASMLSLRPKPSQPSRQLANTLKMLEPELRKQNMGFSYCVDSTYEDCEVGTVMADLLRIGQVLVNLVSNAIKFTARRDGEKKITVSVAASRTRPPSYPPDLIFFDSEATAYRMDVTGNDEWGNGEELYVMMAVKDTGIGISDEGQTRLFQRFQQATPKTEEIYGGSGLGLNICRKLCHLHGGEIGVSAKEGVGSTFGFFFKVKRSELQLGQPSPQEEGDEQDANEHLKGQITALGIASSDELNPQRVDNSPGHLPVEDATESLLSPKNVRGNRYQETKEIANQVNESKSTQRSNEQQTNSLEKATSPLSQQDKTHLNRRTHILLVEDNILNQKILNRKLESKAFHVTTANNGREAVEAVKATESEKGPFDIVLMDQEMPVLDGNGATKEIRRLEEAGEVERIPILGVTANVRGEQTEQMLRSGMDDVISKPYKIDELVSRLLDLINRKKVNGGDESES